MTMQLKRIINTLYEFKWAEKINDHKSINSGTALFKSADKILYDV